MLCWIVFCCVVLSCGCAVDFMVLYCIAFYWFVLLVVLSWFAFQCDKLVMLCRVVLVCIVLYHVVSVHRVLYLWLCIVLCRDVMLCIVLCVGMYRVVSCCDVLQCVGMIGVVLRC